MASDRRRQFRGSETAFRGRDDQWASDVQKLLEQAPQFHVLAKAESGQAPDLSDSQREFLDDFASRVKIPDPDQ